MVISEDLLTSDLDATTVGFQLTRAGSHFGRPVAAFLLECSAQLPYSLLDVFGPTGAAQETTPPLTTARILRFLSVAGAAQREIDVADAARASIASVGTHLRRLARLGLIDYSFLDGETMGQVQYYQGRDPNSGPIDTIGRLPGLTKAVAEVLFRRHVVEAPSVAAALTDAFPRYSYPVLMGEVSRVLSGLAVQGVAIRTKFKAGEIHSQASLTEAGGEIVSQILLPIQRALSDDRALLSEWRSLAWEKSAAVSILKYKEASRQNSSRPMEEWMADVFSIISQNPGIRPREIKESIDRKECSDVLDELIKRGLVRKERRGRAALFFAMNKRWVPLEAN